MEANRGEGGEPVSNGGSQRVIGEVYERREKRDWDTGYPRGREREK